MIRRNTSGGGPAPRGPSRQPEGLGGALGNVKSLSQLVSLLSAHFLPSSYGTPPQASGGTGQRVVALTTKTRIVSAVNGQSGEISLSVPVVDATVVTLVAGTATWTFSQTFSSAPAVTVTPVGLHGGNDPGIYVTTISETGVVFQSTDPTDNRSLLAIAVQPP